MATRARPEDDPGQLIWNDALTAARLFADMARRARGCDAPPATLYLRAAAGPVLHTLLDAIGTDLGTGFHFHKVPVTCENERLTGGLDLATTLATGRPVHEPGILERAHDNVLVLPMADLMAPHALSLIAQAMDLGTVTDTCGSTVPARFSLIVIDQSEDGDACPSLADRCALHITLDGVSIRNATKPPRLHPLALAPALCDDKAMDELTAAALAFGLTSLRPASQAIRIAQHAAALAGRRSVETDDVATAMRLSLLHRATRMPAPPQYEEQAEPEPPQQDESEDGKENTANNGPLEDRTPDIEATQLPEGLLEALLRPRLERQRGQEGRRGSSHLSHTRGRPMPSRPGRPGGGKRLDLAATLREAVCWQRLRPAKSQPSPVRVRTRAADFRIRRFRQARETTTIFIVDASGSTALNRLGEAKGAVELLLAQAYSRRDSVALVSFRGRQADLLLPPTRALAQARRALATLPGGGGTPLASGLKAGLTLALDERRRGRDVSLVLLTDGSPNVGLDGEGGRPQAQADSVSIATAIASEGLPLLVIDLARRATPQTRALCDAADARLVAMPFASASAMARVVEAQRA